MPDRDSALHSTLHSGDQRREGNIRIKNRRRRYLDLHPEYLQSSHLELADPLLYDRLIRRFQSASEREQEDRERGYASTLEANLIRSEAKLEALNKPDPDSPLIYTRAPDGSITAVENDEGERAQGREDGWLKWKDVMELRFLNGRDDQFDYGDVDENEKYDDQDEEERKELEQYLDDEDEKFLGDGPPIGQSGIQDY